jgi:hypothetical protein
MLSYGYTGFSWSARLPSAAVEAAWRSVLSGNVPSGEVEILAEFLGREWPYSAADPRAFRAFLIEKGVNDVQLARIPPAEAQRLKEQFQSRHAQKTLATAELSRSFAKTHALPAFLKAIQPYSEELKTVAYRGGIEESDGHSRALILSMLAEESSETAKRILSGVSRSPLIATFEKFLDGGTYKFQVDEADVDVSNNQTPFTADNFDDPVESAVAAGHLPMSNLINRASVQRQTGTLPSVIAASTRLFEDLPKRSFPMLIRRLLATYLCVAAPEQSHSEAIISSLSDVHDPKLARVLSRFKPGELGKLFDRICEPQHPESEVLVCLVLDALRRVNPKFFTERELQLRRLRDNSVPYIRVLASAAEWDAGLLQNRNVMDAAVTKGLKSAQADNVTVWLAQNPEFVHGIKTKSLGFMKWRNLLHALSESNSIAAWGVIDEASDSFDADAGDRYWAQCLRAVATLEVSERSVQKVAELLSQGRSRGWTQQIGAITASQPVNGWVERFFWQLIAALPRGLDTALSEFPWLSNSRLLKILANGMDLGIVPSTAFDQVCNTLLSREDFDAKLWSASSFEMVRSAATVMATLAMADLLWLQRFPTEFAMGRDAMKSSINQKIGSGLNTAIENCGHNPRLLSQVENLKPAIDRWSVSANGTAGTLPVQVPVFETKTDEEDDELLQQAITRDAKNPFLFAAFVSRNNWAIQRLLSTGPSTPPVADVARLLFSGYRTIRQLRLRASSLLDNLQLTLLSELAIDLREPIAQIEREIAGYFMFRQSLTLLGLAPIEASLGNVINSAALKSESHRLIRDQTTAGKRRNYTLGIAVGGKAVGSVEIMNSGDANDCD